MKRLIPLMLILILGSCATEKRCLVKFPPPEIKDTVYLPGEVFYSDRVVKVNVPGDTAIVEAPWSDDIVWVGLPEGMEPPDISVDHKVEKIRADVSLAFSEAWVENNALKLMLVQKDSVLEFKIDSAIQVSADTLVITKVEKEIQKVIPKWAKTYKTLFWFLLGLTIFVIVAGFYFVTRKR